MPRERFRIGHVLHRLDFAGAEVLAADLSRKLRERYEFVFFCLDAMGAMGERLQTEGFEVVNLGRHPGLDLPLVWRLRRLAKRHRISLFHAHQYSPFSYAAMARFPTTRPNILFTEHGRHYPDGRRLKRLMANRLLLRPRDHVTAVGQFVKRALVDHEGLEPNRIEVIRNGIDPDRFAQPLHDARQAVRTELGIAAAEPIVLQIARFHPVKDHVTALHAFARAKQTLDRAHLVLAGDGPQRGIIEKLAADLRIKSHVHLLGVREDVPRLLAAADVFMLSSLSEGISVTLLEAMATPLPIVATAVGGNAEVVEHGRTGLLSPRQDSTTLGHNLAAMLGNAVLRQRMGVAARRRLEMYFIQRQMHEAYAAAYDRMLGAR